MQMHTPTVAVCLLQSLLSVFVLADNAAFNAADPLRDGDSATCRSVGWADFRLTAKVNVTHIRVYTNKTQQVSFSSCTQAIRSPSFVDFFCTYNTDRIVIFGLEGVTCEIEVGTCAVDSNGKRYYGPDCRTPCSDSCLDGLCGSNTGTCSSCPVGKTGSYCSETSDCPDHLYGQGCSTSCPATCPRPDTGRMCDLTSGYCTQPCPTGKKGIRCDEASDCPDDRYRSDCSTDCPGTCPRPASGRMCDVRYGDCTQPCPEGKKGRRCDEDCGYQEYGANCNKTCSTCPWASGRRCDVQTGKCVKACLAGQTGLQCESCTNDYYGVRCANPCPSTCPSPPTGRQCDISYGHCTQPCPAGKKGNECNQDCPYNYFGQNCNSRCNTNCQREAASFRYCHAETGACLGLCSSGKRGVNCDQDCAPGTYGKGDSTGCPKHCGNCEGGSCRATDGECTGGCKPGWQPTVCKKACDPGTYGQDCQTPCGNCDDSTCDLVDGHCNGVCKAGWKGWRCDKQCDKGTFGQGDGARCPHGCGHCKDVECRPDDGRCTRGCEPGWQSSYCNTSCDDGTFGDCRKQCACRNSSEVCNKSTGMCQSGCRDGKTEVDCQQDCPDRYFGNCKTPCRCKDPSERCDKVTGKCNSGCPDGKSGDNCYQCQAGRYGIDCENTCHCRDTTEACDPASGACKSGCPIGWRGSDCQDKCKDGVFGDNCGSPCQTTCTNSSCHHETGHCALGCVEGWEGDDCSKVLSSVPVAAIAGSLAALIIIIIAVFGFCYWRRKKGKMADPGCEEIATSRRFSGLAGVSNHNHDNVVEDANAMKEEEEENWYEKIEEAEDQPRMAAAPGIQTNEYEGLDSTTRWTSPSAPYGPLQGSGAVISPRVYENHPKVTATNPATSSDHANTVYEN